MGFEFFRKKMEDGRRKTEDGRRKTEEDSWERGVLASFHINFLRGEYRKYSMGCILQLKILRSPDFCLPAISFQVSKI